MIFQVYPIAQRVREGVLPPPLLSFVFFRIFLGIGTFVTTVYIDRGDEMYSVETNTNMQQLTKTTTVSRFSPFFTTAANAHVTG